MVEPSNIPIFPQQPLNLQLREYIWEAFWPDVKSSEHLSEYASYFEFFEKTISTVALSAISLDPQTFAMRTYGDLMKVMECLKLNRNPLRSTVLANLQTMFPGSDANQRQRSIELTARLWLMIHMRSPVGPTLTMTPLTWPDERSLSETFRLWFPKEPFCLK